MSGFPVEQPEAQEMTWSHSHTIPSTCSLYTNQVCPVIVSLLHVCIRNLIISTLLVTLNHVDDYDPYIDDPDAEGRCSVVIALMQEHRRSQRHLGVKTLQIGFIIYKVASACLPSSYSPVFMLLGYFWLLNLATHLICLYTSIHP